jgi:hypothetical protein
VITDPTTEAGKELVRLHAQAEEATRILHACEQAQQDAQAAVRVAEGALAAELDRGATSGEQNAKTEVGLVRKIEDARIAADPSLHVPRIEAAVGRQIDAVLAVRSHIECNITELLAELMPDAERITAELAEARSAMSPYLQAYHEMAERVNTLTAAVHRFKQPAPQNRFTVGQPIALNTYDRWALPPGDAEVPMPDAAVLEQWDRRFHPERYPAPVADEPTDAAA